MRIVIPDDFPPVYAPYPEVLEPLRARAEVVIYSTRPESQAELAERIHGADIAINVRAYAIFDAGLLEALPHLRLIAVMGTGIDNVDLAAATARGIVVCNVPAASTRSVAELALALMLACSRRVAFLDRKMRAGTWEHRPGLELQGRTLGVVGLGLIGQEMARLGRALGMRVLGWSLHHDQARAAACGAELMDLETLLRRSDVVSLHLRLSSQTARLLGERELALMRPGTILVNTARAGLVDGDALLAALKNGHLGGAGLDVHVPEPLPATSPFLELDNVVLTPHVGWVTDAASQRLLRGPVENILAYLDGKPRNVVR